MHSFITARSSCFSSLVDFRFLEVLPHPFFDFEKKCGKRVNDSLITHLFTTFLSLSVFLFLTFSSFLFGEIIQSSPNKEEERQRCVRVISLLVCFFILLCFSKIHDALFVHYRKRRGGESPKVWGH